MESNKPRDSVSENKYLFLLSNMGINPKYKAGVNQMGFNYVNIVSVNEECDGWLNLFFDDECVAMVDNVDLANRMRENIPEKDRVNLK